MLTSSYRAARHCQHNTLNRTSRAARQPMTGWAGCMLSRESNCLTLCWRESRLQHLSAALDCRL